MLTCERFRLEVEKLVQSGPEMITMGNLPKTERARKVLTFAEHEASDLQHDFVGTEHLLLGLIREKDGVAATVLSSLFTVVKLESLSEERTADIVGLGAEELELRHLVIIPPETIAEATRLAAELDTPQEMPNSAIKLLDYASAHKKLFAPVDSEKHKNGLQEYQKILGNWEETMSRCEYPNARLHMEELTSIRTEHLAALPESVQPVVAPEDIRLAFETIDS
jgi:ATP-dependent Clp protease ATP-binding subunit ClpA